MSSKSPQDKDFLGEGSYGKVFKKNIGGKDYAVKQIISNDVNEIDGFIAEVDMLMKIDHPNVIRAVDFYLAADESFHLVLELGVSLDKVLGTSLSFIDRLSYIHNIGCGIDFVMNSGYAHCDIKTENILIVNGVAKIADFGLVTRLNPLERSSGKDSEMCQTYWYRSPEHVIEELKNITPMSEIWAYGFVVLFLIYNKKNIVGDCLERNNTSDIIDLLSVYKRYDPIIAIEKLFGKIPNDFDEIKDEVGQLQQFDPKKRTRDLGNFLKHSLFYQNNIEYNIDIGTIRLPNDEILAQNVNNGNHIDIVVKWLVDVCIELDIELQAMCLAIEMIRRIQHRYDLKRNNLQLFGISCFFLAERIIGGINLTSREAVRLSDNSFTEMAFSNFVFDIITKEKCALSYMTIYNITKTKKAFLESLRGILNSSIYYKENMRSSANIAREYLNKYPPRHRERNISLRDIISDIS